MSLPFTDSQLNTLRTRVKEAEEGTPGEIVVFVVPRSGSYEVVLWRAASFGLLFSLLVWAGVASWWPGWGTHWVLSPLFGIALSGAGSIAGALLAHVSGSVLRALAGRSMLKSLVHQRAQRTFLEQGVSETAARTGILVFVSLLERRIEVIADRGISSVVSENRWQEVVNLIRQSLAEGEMIRGLSKGIAACGEILRSSGISSSGSDRNELSDDIRFETD